VPQYFQGVMGSSPEGSGIRLLPVVGGLIVGLVPAAWIANRIGSKLTVAAGFAILAIALGLGATTSVSTEEGFTALWMAIAGAGTGLTMATAATTALGELSEERAGVGSGVLQALKNTGAPLGAAILGSTVASVYVSRLDLAGVPPAPAQTTRQSVFGGLAVARALHSNTLLISVKTAFVHGLDEALVVSFGFAIAGLVLALIFLPTHVRASTEAEGKRPGGERVAA
jgi:MFS family permease